MNTTVQNAATASVGTAFNDRSIGKKILMAVTGVVAFGYVVGHMFGNLQIFAGQDQLNTYAETLHSLGPLLWAVRGFLILFFLVHIWKGIQLKLENWSSRPISYRMKKAIEATLSSRTMIWTGLIILAFVVYHLLQFTIRVTNPEYQHLVDPLGRPDVYSMVIMGFQNPLISGFYILAVGLLCYHLSHGISSMFQTVGWANKRTLPALEVLGIIVAWLIFLGYVSIPISILAGGITLPKGGVVL